MKFLRKGMALTLCMALLGLLLAACGGNSSSSDSNAGGSGSSSSSTSDSSGSGKTAYMIISTLNNPFFVSLKQGAEKKAKDLGFKLVVQNANNDNLTELNQARTDIQKKPAALILDPVDSNAIVSAINAANKAGVPVFAFDRKPKGGDIKTFIGYDAIAAGKRAADALAKGLNGKGKVVEIQGIMGTNVAQDRSKGFEQEIAKKYPNIQIVTKQPADFDRSKALDVMTNILQAHPNINGVYAANDEMAMGVLAALKSRSLDGKVVLVGNDGIEDSIKAIKAGEMYATNAESPFSEGIKVSEIASDLIKGKSVPKETTLEGQIVTKKNVDKYVQHLKEIGVPWAKKQK